LVGTDLSYGDLTGANFTEANLRGADLHLTTAMLANFTKANLVGTDFRDADLLGAVFTEATFDRSTRWPELFDPVAKGAIDIDESDSRNE
ncbi:MAG: pentapeptide repeat-containing protein, partial [Truepera sp.]|nr:pentapeptide repeat-containing protein [Truepera sp.]